MVYKAKFVSVDNSFETLHTTCYNTSAFPQWHVKRNRAGKSWAVHLGMEDSCLRRTATKVKRGSNMDAQTHNHFSCSHSATTNDSRQGHISQQTKYCILHGTTAGKNATSAPTKTFKCADKTAANRTQHRIIVIFTAMLEYVCYAHQTFTEDSQSRSLRVYNLRTVLQTGPE